LVETISKPRTATSSGARSARRAIFVFAGPAQRGSDLAALRRPPGLLPITRDGKCNVLRLLEACRAISIAPGPDVCERILVPDFEPSPSTDPQVREAMVPDRTQFRGTAGVLRDAAEDLPDDAQVLVLNAAEVYDDRIGRIINQVLSVDDDVVLSRDEVGRPLGVWTIHARCLRAVPGVGFQDLKEQVLPQLARRFSVRVLTLDASLSGTTIGRIRDRATYLACRAGLTDQDHERSSLLEDTARIHDRAIVSDVLCLHGSTIEAGATVARSILGPGGTIPSGHRVVDAVITEQDLE